MGNARLVPTCLLLTSVGLALSASARPHPKPGHAKPTKASSPSGAKEALPAAAAPAASAAAAAPPDATAVPAAATGGTAPASHESVWASCIEHLPTGITRPKVVEQFPSRGLSGYAAALSVQVEHGKGEVVLPQGFQVQTGTDAARVLTDAGFILPDPNGSGAPSIVPSAAGGADPGSAMARTSVTIPFLLLPKTPGRHAMTLPPVPVAIARASGEVLTLCTQPHTIIVDDPTASIPDAKPRPNPPPRLQRETWVLARQVVLGALGGAAVAALAAWLIARWKRRPKPVPPPPPPRPAWEIAFEELRAIRFAELIAQQRIPEHFDRVSDALRKYLGGRYGFDGLETTTFEMQFKLRSVSPPPPELGAIFGLLDTCDLVKFARLTPSEEDARFVLDEAERIVRATMPVFTSPPEVAA